MAGSSAASRSDQPPSGGPGSHRYHRRAAAAAPSSSGSNGQRSRPAGEGRHRPPGREPPVGHAPTAAVGAAARGGPCHGGEGVGGRDLDDPELRWSEGGHGGGGVPDDGHRRHLAVGLLPPRHGQLLQGPGGLQVVAGRGRGAGRGSGDGVAQVCGLGRVGHLELVGAVGGQRVVGLPRLEPQGQLQDCGVDAVVADEVVAPHDPLVGGHPGLGRPGDMGPQLGSMCGWRRPPRPAARGRSGRRRPPARRRPPVPALPAPAGTRRGWPPATAGAPARPPCGIGRARRRPRPSRGRRTDGRP